jgi:ATP-dependent Clp protease ATP-binding subunit ClpA
MFARIRRRLNDMKVIKDLCQLAEGHANADGHQRPGSEHFVLAALELPDGTARRVFERLKLDPDNFRPAIARQYADALQHIGIDLPSTSDTHTPAQPVPQGVSLYHAQPTAASLMQRMAQYQKANPGTTLTGAHVILIAVEQQHGTAPRAFRAMGADPAALARAAVEEIACASHK